MIGATMPCLRMIRVSFRSWARLWVRTERSGGRRSLTERSVISVAEPEEFIGQTRFRSVRPQDASHEAFARKQVSRKSWRPCWAASRGPNTDGLQRVKLLKNM